MERIILAHLLHNEKYAREVLPHIKPEYFNEIPEKVIFEKISDYFGKYNAIPNMEALNVDISNAKLTEDQFDEVSTIIEKLEYDETTEQRWLRDKTEEFCRESAITSAILEGVQAVRKKSKVSVGSIPKMLEDALAVSFDTSIGHDYVGDAEERFDFYHEKQKKIEFDLHYMNMITGGGLEPKTLSCFLAGTGVGKSHVMCHMAAYNLISGRNVLYITCEMGDKKIAQRIDQHLLDTTVEGLMNMTKTEFMRRLDKVKQTTKGRLIVKEYAPGTVSADNFRYVLNELRMKQKLIPDIIYIDYINLVNSCRLKTEANSYTIVKAVAEELRAIAVEWNLPVVTATQTNRMGMKSMDVDLDNVAESVGLPATVDFMAAIMVDEDLAEKGQMAVKQLKNRFGDIYRPSKFLIGMDRSKMRLFDIQQEDDDEDAPVMDKTDAMRNEATSTLSKFKSKIRSTEGFH